MLPTVAADRWGLMAPYFWILITGANASFVAILGAQVVADVAPKRGVLITNSSASNDGRPDWRAGGGAPRIIRKLRTCRWGSTAPYFWAIILAGVAHMLPI